MELYFEHNNEKILNFNDVARREITKIYSKTKLMTGDSNLAIKEIGEKLTEMYQTSRESYNFYTQTMYASTYAMLTNSLKHNTLNEEDLITFNIIRYVIEDSEDIMHYIFNRAGVFDDLVKNTVLFEKLNLLGRKAVIQNNIEYNSDIIEIAPLYAFDILRYSCPATTEDFLDYYKETFDNFVLDKGLLANDIKYHMRHLYLYDKDVYLQNLKKMTKVFYKWTKFKQSINEIENEELLQCLSIIENNSEDKLCELSLSDDKLLFHIILHYCERSTMGGIIIKNNYISEEYIDEYIKDKIPESLKENIKKIKK